MTGYHCPMHADQTSPGPGRCPVCRMHLVPDQAARAAPDPGLSAASCCSMEHAR